MAVPASHGLSVCPAFPSLSGGWGQLLERWVVPTRIDRPTTNTCVFYVIMSTLPCASPTCPCRAGQRFFGLASVFVPMVLDGQVEHDVFAGRYSSSFLVGGDPANGRGAEMPRWDGTKYEP